MINVDLEESVIDDRVLEVPVVVIILEVSAVEGDGIPGPAVVTLELLEIVPEIAAVGEVAETLGLAKT